MITEHKRWMAYTYFNHNPKWNIRTTHLFSPALTSIPGMKRVPFQTMIVDLKKPDFQEDWSASTRTKLHRAQNEPLIIERGEILLPVILKLFNPSARSKGLRGFEQNDFDTFPYVECSAILSNGVMLCGHIWVIDPEEKRALLYVNASHHHNDGGDRSLTGRAHYYLLWQDGLFLRQLGIETMDLMGYEMDSPDPGLKGVYQWKAGTHGQQKTLYHYYPSWFFLLRKLRNMLTG